MRIDVLGVCFGCQMERFRRDCRALFGAVVAGAGATEDAGAPAEAAGDVEETAAAGHPIGYSAAVAVAAVGTLLAF